MEYDFYSWQSLPFSFMHWVTQVKQAPTTNLDPQIERQTTYQLSYPSPLETSINYDMDIGWYMFSQPSKLWYLMFSHPSSLWYLISSYPFNLWYFIMFSHPCKLCYLMFSHPSSLYCPISFTHHEEIMSTPQP